MLRSACVGLFVAGIPAVQSLVNPVLPFNGGPDPRCERHEDIREDAGCVYGCDSVYHLGWKLNLTDVAKDEYMMTTTYTYTLSPDGIVGTDTGDEWSDVLRKGAFFGKITSESSDSVSFSHSSSSSSGQMDCIAHDISELFIAFDGCCAMDIAEHTVDCDPVFQFDTETMGWRWKLDMSHESGHYGSFSVTVAGSNYPLTVGTGCVSSKSTGHCACTPLPVVDLCTDAPTAAPTTVPSAAPTTAPTQKPTKAPTAPPTSRPTRTPTVSTMNPTTRPTMRPTMRPTTRPTTRPSTRPTTTRPTTTRPTTTTPMPTRFGGGPTMRPTMRPTTRPTTTPTSTTVPTRAQPPGTGEPTAEPTYDPTMEPTAFTLNPTIVTMSPTVMETTAVETSTERPRPSPTSECVNDNGATGCQFQFNGTVDFGVPGFPTRCACDLCCANNQINPICPDNQWRVCEDQLCHYVQNCSKTGNPLPGPYQVLLSTLSVL